ncbi:PTS mannose transporter subunit IID [Secundilactobacillus paracollinoides]|uniref:PTS mannose transporter subunit IID n=1 Tax=Secundilactobacillus paracollinoides TaxID=240427 RepID=A0A1B2IZK9_9LACO|nr:PTS system mannose/fructose/sorbose family transporter subunit IID [Secundilactobacillus paracollinoides]ANZ61517.1 PTS mannose transporter subunit IID [Secundilactobacillus paracollinoides]ANZ64094.1 PTS mannose transporter subunit IID [Secundilactobacillus paracollinoides]ANZ67438.1 PTS mannose transporter subunit IID [Secundilactobacillus paracollinoides]KRL78574.1 mannose-specific PTS system component IID [Secundilactobacillus paracollinoides DSM 15502 = JCM 11969]
MTDKQQTPRQLTRGDLVSIFWRSGFEQASWNYERMQNLGFAYIMVPAIKRLYPDKTDQIDAMQRHLAFFNTMPYMQSAVTGVVLSMEEQRANGAPITGDDISSTKIGMMGPLAGIGDPVWWGTLRPVLAAFAVGLIKGGTGLLGPAIFFFGWNIMRLGFRWWTQRLGYREGTDIVQVLSSSLIPKLTQGASIVGMFIMGVLVPRWTTIYFPKTIAHVSISGHLTRLTGQGLLDQLLPGIIPLGLTMSCFWLLRHRVKPIWLIIGLFILGILGYWSGILGLTA